MKQDRRDDTSVPAPRRRQRVWWRILVGLFMIGVIVFSLWGWFATREPLPETIRIATGRRGGLYERVGELAMTDLARRLGRDVRVVQTAGSVENEALLLSGEADLAVLQAGATPFQDVLVVTPLYLDVVHVVVRHESDITSLDELEGRRLALGHPGSGMRASAGVVLGHYGIDSAGIADRDFTELATDPELEAAVVTTGLLSPSLSELLGSGNFRLLPVPDAKALSLRHAALMPFEIPRGLYRERPPLPAQDLTTVATTSVLAVRRDAPEALVRAALGAIYENDLRRVLPTLIGREEAEDWNELPRHPAAAGYFDPYSGLGILANFMESLAALKELLFALGAALYLGWSRFRRQEERERVAAMRREKEHLDGFLKETMRIEREQMGTDDAARLRYYLDEVTRINLRALEELTSEDLRGNQAFAIFLQQCANLIRKIQAKLDVVVRDGHYPPAAASGSGDTP